MNRLTIPIALLAVALLGAGAACKKSAAPMSPAEKAASEAKAIIDEAAAAEEEANKPAPKVESKMSDEAYIEIAARFVLLHEKYKEDPETIDLEMEKAYEKFGVTQTEYQEFKKVLTPEKEGELTRKIQDKMQTLEREYK